MLDEAERSLHDALCVLQQTVQDSRVIYGGGYPEMQMAKVDVACVQQSGCRCALRCAHLPACMTTEDTTCGLICTAFDTCVDSNRVYARC